MEPSNCHILPVEGIEGGHRYEAGEVGDRGGTPYYRRQRLNDGRDVIIPHRDYGHVALGKTLVEADVRTETVTRSSGNDTDDLMSGPGCSEPQRPAGSARTDDHQTHEKPTGDTAARLVLCPRAQLRQCR